MLERMMWAVFCIIRLGHVLCGNGYIFFGHVPFEWICSYCFAIFSALPFILHGHHRTTEEWIRNIFFKFALAYFVWRCSIFCIQRYNSSYFFNSSNLITAGCVFLWYGRVETGYAQRWNLVINFNIFDLINTRYNQRNSDCSNRKRSNKHEQNMRWNDLIFQRQTASNESHFTFSIYISGFLCFF